MLIKPAPGIKVRDPVTRQHLPESGKDVLLDSYWVRCLESGDVLLVKPTETPREKTEK